MFIVQYIFTLLDCKEHNLLLFIVQIIIYSCFLYSTWFTLVYCTELDLPLFIVQNMFYYCLWYRPWLPHVYCTYMFYHCLLLPFLLYRTNIYNIVYSTIHGLLMYMVQKMIYSPCSVQIMVNSSCLLYRS